MAKNNNLKDYLTDLYEGIVSKKADASRNPQNFRAEIEAIQTDNPKPVKVSTEAEMNALLELETTPIGGIYKYTGETTEAYKHYHLYKVLEREKGGKYFKHLPITAGTLDITTNGYYDVEEKQGVDVKVPDNPKPIEVSSVVDMTTALLAAEVGSVYKYTGESGTVLEDMSTFEKGALYELQKASAGDSRRWAKLQSDEWIIDFYIVADANTTLSFKAVDGMKWSEWLVTDYNAQTITTLADGTMVFSDSDVRINADINDYIIAGHTYTVTVPALTSPTIDITESTLNIYDEEGLATSYDILVDGEVKATVEKANKTVNITLSASFGGLNNDVTTYIKFGAKPTSNDDAEYWTPNGSTSLTTPNGNVGNNISIEVLPIAYIWVDKTDNMAGYKLNDGGVIDVGVGYANATEVQLSEGDSITLVSTGLD